MTRTVTVLGLVGLLAIAGVVDAQVASSPGEVTPLLIGSEVPSATVRQLDGTEVDLREVVGDDRTVVIFYRGGW